MKHEPIDDHAERKRISALIEQCEKEQTMSRWIDAEWLMNFFVDIPDNFTLTIGNLRATVNNAPSIDIVRCRECRYYYNKDPEQIPTANIMCSHMHPDDFCSYGSYGERE